jgi:uncharacterized cupin superfamily protein
MSKYADVWNIELIKPKETVSPERNLITLRRSFSEVLGKAPGNRDQPFDVEHVVVPAGKANFPMHSHAVMWEFYWVLGGKGTLRLENERILIRKGDFFVCPPGEAHQLIAGKTADLAYVVISDNVAADVIHYPESGKWMAKPGRFCFRETLDYYDGEPLL